MKSSKDALKYLFFIFSFLGVASGVPIRADGVFNRSGVFKSGVVGRVLMMRVPGQSIIRRLAPRASRTLKHRLIAYNMSKAPAMSGDTRARLAEAFREDIERLGGLIGRDLSCWLENSAPHATPQREDLASALPTNRAGGGS